MNLWYYFGLLLAIAGMAWLIGDIVSENQKLLKAILRHQGVKDSDIEKILKSKD